MNAPARAWLDSGPRTGKDPIDDVPDPAYALAARILREHQRSTGTRSHPPIAIYCGSNSDRQSVGRPGHCSVCVIIGHVAAHPDLGCAEVGCASVHDTPQKRKPKIISQGYGHTSSPVRSPGEPPTGIPDEAYLGIERVTGSPFAVYRFGTTVVEWYGSEPVRVADAGDARFARARFAMATGDPDGPAAPIPGDLVDLFSAGGHAIVKAVEPDGDGGYLLTIRGRHGAVHVSGGAVAILARPARARNTE